MCRGCEVKRNTFVRFKKCHYQLKGLLLLGLQALAQKSDSRQLSQLRGKRKDSGQIEPRKSDCYNDAAG